MSSGKEGKVKVRVYGVGMVVELGVALRRSGRRRAQWVQGGGSEGVEGEEGEVRESKFGRGGIGWRRER